MTEKKPFYRNIDEFVFKQIDNLKESPLYQEAMTRLSSLNDLQIKVISQATSLIIIFVPFLILLIILLMNINSNNKLALKKEILTEINNFSSAQKRLQTVGKNIISGVGILSRNDFQKKVSNSLVTSGGNRTDLRVNDFESTPTDGIVKANGVVRFSKLSTPILTSFLADLVDRGKFRISNILIKKKLKDKIVSGQLELQHYGREVKGK